MTTVVLHRDLQGKLRSGHQGPRDIMDLDDPLRVQENIVLRRPWDGLECLSA